MHWYQKAQQKFHDTCHSNDAPVMYDEWTVNVDERYRAENFTIRWIPTSMNEIIMIYLL